MMAISLPLKEIEQLIVKALSDYKKIHGSNDLTISDDIYWKIPDQMVSNFDVEPSNFEVGNYIEEVEFLRKKFDSGDVVGSESLGFLSAILQKLSAQE
jgi:hypothetical protein